MKKTLFLLICLIFTQYCVAAQVTFQMRLAHPNHKGKIIGTISAKDTRYGLLLMPNLHSLPPGIHGFHAHEHPNCTNNAKGAGGHYDPYKSNSHQGPYGRGHKGDLPVLIVNNAGKATIPVLAPRLRVRELKRLSLMIHQGADTYSDAPKLGGGGARLACGILHRYAKHTFQKS